MNFWRRQIFTGFAPNLNKQDVFLSLKYFCLPWYWKNLRRGEQTEKAENFLEKYLKIKKVIAFDSGRSALYFALQNLGSNSGSEILVQAYTCLVVINAIHWTGGTPIYVDVDNNFNMDPDSLLKKITPQSKILIIQHTFGKPANLEKLLAIAKQHNLKVIEDCAHSLGAKYQNNYLGTLADAAILSFGPDKIISSIRGGAVITNNEILGTKLKEIQKQLPQTPLKKVFQHLAYYPIFAFCKPLYNLFIGKFLLVIAKTLGFYSRIIYQEEKIGLPVLAYPAQLPNCLANILNQQLNNLDNNLLHRKKIAEYYHKNLNSTLFIKPVWDEDSVWLRYTILTANPQKLHTYAKKNNIILGNWYDSPIAPKDIDLAVCDYILGDCPNDEKLAKMSVNLPTDPTISKQDAEYVIDILNNYV